MAQRHSALAIVMPLLQEGGRSLYRAEEGAQRRRVLLEIGSPASAYELTRSLSARCVLKPTARTTYEGVSTLVLEDFDGVSLRSLLDRPMPLERFLRLGIRIAEALGEIHHDGVIHKDIRPESILVDPESGNVKLVGFAFATRAPREPALGPPPLIEGSLPYMSPEQTGRMNRAMDQRSDLYSLGVTFYRMLTGRLPFQASDPVEWVYCHVAREPLPPTTHLPGLPATVSEIVMKLLAKVAEDRYQTARGVAVDLTKCIEQWTKTGAVEPFRLGERDVSERLHMPERFYGREAELAQLVAAFHRVVDRGKPELVLVSGHPGIGKSSLVRELHRPLLRERGSFIVGKADQYSRGVRYSTIATGLRDLVLESLAGSNASVRRLRTAILDTLGPNAGLVIDLIPELELLVGKQPPAIPLPPAEAKYRFLSTCQKLVAAFARRDHPLTLFLDDLQWADAASLELLQHLLTHPDTKYVLALGAYRDTEVGPSHPLAAMLDDVRNDGACVTNLHLSALSPGHVTELVADAVHASRDEVSPLSRLVHGKTEGNPFFVLQFMGTLIHDKLLEFDDSSLAWRWNVPRIEARDYTDNVVALMVQKIERLPENTRSILQLAACMGTLAETGTLEVLSHRSESEIHLALQPAVQEGLLLRRDGSYRFLHDRIQQAAYSLVAEDERAEFQLEIGRSLVASPDQREEHFFDIANHFLLGISAIEAPAERARSAGLFLEAGRRAKSAMAYKGALTFLSAGVALLEPTSWDEAYELAYALHFEQAECEWLSGNFEAAERSLPPLLSHARTTTEKLHTYGIRVRLHGIRSEHESAICAGLDALRLIGIDWSLHPGADEVRQARDVLRERLGDRAIESLLDLPAMTNTEMKAALDLVALMFDIAYFVDSNLHRLLASFAVSSSLRYGNAASSFMGYAVCAFVSAHDGRYEESDRFAQVALACVGKPGSKPLAPKICVTVGVTTLPWVRPYRAAADFLERAAGEAAEIGDFVYSCYGESDRPRLLFAAGEALSDLYLEVQRSIDAIRKAKHDQIAEVQCAFARVIQELRGLSSFEETNGFEERAERTWSGFNLCQYWTWQLQSRYVFEDYRGALDVARKLECRLDSIRGIHYSSQFHFYHALTLAAACDEASTSSREEYLAALRAHEQAFCAWTKSCPENFAAEHVLLRAEIARITREGIDAEKLYEEAIALARESGLVHVEAIANEVAARFYRARGLTGIAKMYLREARAAYARWGAAGKVQELDGVHPELRERAEPAYPSIASRPEQLDLMSVVKAAQTISGELELDRLVDRLIQVVLEQSGAELGRLLLVREGTLRVESEARATGRGAETTHVSGGCELVPASIVHYVWRTREKVLLADAREPNGRGKFVSDDYLTRVRPKSVLCLPILRGAAVVGLLYLENNLVPHAFTPERITALDVIASQAAITLEVAFWIRQEHEARDALATSEARFRRLSDSNMIGIVFGDMSGRLTKVNDYFLEMLGYTQEDLARGLVLWTALTPPEHAAKDQGALRELELAGVCRPFEKEYVRKDGSRVPVLLGIALLEGSKTETVAYILDITERRRAERQRDHLLVQEQHARAEAEEALRARDDFLTIAAHELRTPLTPLKMQIEVLTLLARQTIPSDSIARRNLFDMLDKSNQQVDRLSALITDLLDISRIGTGHLSFSTQPTDLAEVVRDLVERYQAELVRAACPIEIGGESRLVGQWDRVRVEQVVVNLLTNAMKYGAGKPIAMRLGRKGGEAILTVRDHGIGIDERDQARIFDRFERAVSIRHFGGFGLGLYVSREIVRAHGGSISVESRPGAGATFTVRLPFDPRPQGRRLEQKFRQGTLA